MEDDLNSFISVSVRCLHTVLMKCAMQHSLDSLKQATLSVVIRAFGDSPYSADPLEGLVNWEGAAILDGHDIEEEGVILVLEVHVKEEADGLEVHFEVWLVITRSSRWRGWSGISALPWRSCRSSADTYRLQRKMQSQYPRRDGGWCRVFATSFFRSDILMNSCSIWSEVT